MFNVSIAIDNATVSSKANSLENVWELMVPALMAAGFDLEIQVIYSLHDFVERSGKFIVTERDVLAEAYQNGYNAGLEEGYKKGNRDEYERVFPLIAKDRAEKYNAGFEDGVKYAKSGGKIQSKDQSLCGND